MRQMVVAIVAIMILSLTPIEGQCQQWDTTGCWLRDTLPTSPCAMGVASVDSISNHIVVMWTPSPDSDIAGYYLCSGIPCIGLDTVWGRDDTMYVCSDLLPQEPHQFRVLAFDSCFNASALTPRFGNLVLQVRYVECPTRVEASWMGCDTLPGGVGGFCVLVGINGQQEVPIVTLSADVHQYVYNVAEGITDVTMRVAVLDMDGELRAWSNGVEVPIQVFDSSWRLSISEIHYDEVQSGVCLQFDVQRGFGGEYYDLYRSQNGRTAMLLERFEDVDEELWEYWDYDLAGEDTLLRYYLERVDSCGNVRQRSIETGLRVPSSNPVTAFFPNIFTPAREDNNLFKGYYVSIIDDDFEFTIYNRMGEQIFCTQDIREGWDGTHLGALMPMGVYVYHVRCTKRGGGVVHFTGTIFLVR